MNFDASKITRVSGKLSLVLFVLQLLALLALIAAMRSDYYPFSGLSSNNAGMAILLLPTLEVLMLFYYAKFVAMAGFLLGLIYLSKTPRNSGPAWTGIVGNLAIAVTGLVFHL